MSSIVSGVKLIDNVNQTLRDDLSDEINSGSSISIAAAYFSMYAFSELKKELKKVDNLKFIFTSPTFIKECESKEKREFYIPRQERTQSLWIRI